MTQNLWDAAKAVLREKFIEINHGKKNGKRINTWRLNNTQLKTQWVNDEIKRRNQKIS